MILTMNQKEMELGGKYLGWLCEANDLLGDREALQARLEEDGYLLIRGLHDPEKVKATRRFLLEKLDENEQLDRAYPLSGRASRRKASAVCLSGGNKAVTHEPPFSESGRIAGDNGLL